MSLTERKAGGAAVDPDDYNEVVDAVVALQASSVGPQPTIYTGDAPINPSGTLVELAEETPSTSGTFTLTFGGETTEPIAFDAVAEDIVNALGALTGIGYQLTVEDGYSGVLLNEGAVRFHYTGALQGPTAAPTVTNDLTDNGVAVTLDFPGDPGDPELPALYDLYVVAGTPPLLYVFDGSSWAITSVGSGAITTAKIATGAVTTTQLGLSSVTSDKIGTGAVGSSNIAEGAVISGKIAANAVSDAQIVDTNVTTAKLANGAVTADKMGTPVAHLAHGSTVDQLIDALITGKVMAAS